MTERRKQAIVVGAGISGLSAANLLYEDGIDVVVLEARDRVGGRTYTKRDPFYNYLDVGGAYVGPTQDHIFRMAKNLGLETYKIHCSGDYVHYSKGHGLRFQGTWPQFRNPFAWLDVNALFRYMDKLLEEIPVEAPWDAPHAEEWDNMTMKEFYNQVCWTEEAKEFGRGFCNTNVTAEPSEISCLWFLWYVKSCGGTRRIWETENGGQERKFVGGSMQVSERLAEKLGSGRVFFESPVKSIAQGEDHVEVCTLSGTTFTADFVILAIPPSLQLGIHFEPALSSHRIQLIQRVPVGSCIKNQMYYKTAFWREKGLSGFGSAADGIEPIGNTVDDCKPDGSMPGLVGFVMADRARDFAKLTKEERKRQTCECYARLFDSEEALHPIGYEELNWMSEPYSGGCYTSTYPPGVMTRFGSELRKPYGRLFFAGTETAVSWTGYMNGAVEAGERAAREILHAMGKIPADQIFQEEPVFEEVPHKPFEMSFMERNAPSVGGCLKLAGGATVLGVLGYATYRNGVMETYESALASLKSLTSFAY